MGRYAARTRRPRSAPAAWVELPGEVSAVLPPRFLAVGEAQAAGTSTLAPCREAGRRLADDGVALDEALEALHLTSVLVVGRDPDYAEIVALSVAWSDTTLGYFHRLSCSDPMTGLATQAHLRSRLTELYRGHDVRRTHALVVVGSAAEGALSPALEQARLGDVTRTVFDGGETVAGVGRVLVVALVERDDQLARRAALLRTLLERSTARTWVEGLPGSDLAAGALLDELARL
jgi:hypothetical protein